MFSSIVLLNFVSSEKITSAPPIFAIAVAYAIIRLAEVAFWRRLLSFVPKSLPEMQRALKTSSRMSGYLHKSLSSII